MTDRVTIDANFPELTAALGEFASQADFAVALAISDAVQAGRDAWPAIAAAKIENPTRFTQNAAYATRATKRRLRAEVGIKTLQAGYLRPLFEGGNRDIKLVERISGYPRAVPADLSRRNKFGNIARRRYVEVFRQAKNRGGKFVLNPDDRPRGIYERTRRGLKPLFFFVDRADYEPTLSMARDVAPIVRRRLPIALDNALSRALATANRKAGTARR